MEKENLQVMRPGDDEDQGSGICLFNISYGGLQQLLESKLDLNALFILDQLRLQIPLPPDNPKINAWMQALVRKKYATQQATITIKGMALLREVANGAPDVPVVLDIKDDPFERWWKHAYPATDYLEHNGRIFPGTQKKHQDKEICRKLYWDIINEGIYSTEDIYLATVCQIDNAKDLSLIKNESQIHFIANSRRYLEKRLFEPFVNAGRKRAAATTKQTHLVPSNNFDFDI